jgi:hypothetical protein
MPAIICTVKQSRPTHKKIARYIAEGKAGFIHHMEKHTSLRSKLTATCTVPKYSSAPVSTGNMFQDLPQLRETADNTERYILRDIRLTNINTVKFK